MDQSEKEKSLSPRPSESSSSNKLTFVNITHPDQSKDSGVLKQVRRQAMHFYLNQSGSAEPSETQANRLSPYQRTVLENSMETPTNSRHSRRPTSPSEDVQDNQSSSSVMEDTKPPSSESKRSSRSSNPPGNRRVKIGHEISSPSGRHSSLESPGSQLQLLKYNWNIFFGSEELESSWQRMGSEDPLFNYSAICISARHTDALKRNANNPATTTMHNEVVNNLKQKLQQPSEQTSDMTIAATVHICLSDLYASKSDGDWADLLRQLVEMRGGMRMLDFSFSGLSRIVLIATHLSGVIYETAPNRVFQAAAIEAALDPNYTQGFESPLCHPDGTFNQICSDANTPQKLVELLDCVRQAIDVAGSPFADSSTRWHHVQQQKEHTRRQLLEFKAMPKPKAKGQEKEQAHMFEACRLAFVILERALFYSQPLSEAVIGRNDDLELLYRLQRELAQTHLDLGWGDLAGVLLWVSLVGAAATNGNQERDEEANNLRAYLVGCAVRTTLKYAFKYPGELLTALCTFCRVQEVCVRQNPGK